MNCDLPEQKCSPTEWNGTKFDTSYYNSGKNYYYVLKQVEGLNSHNQEYSVYLEDAVYSNDLKQKAYFATISDGTNQRIFSIDKMFDKKTMTQSNDKFKVNDELFKEIKGNMGFPVYIAPNRLIIALTQNNALSTNGQQLLPFEATIGQSRLNIANDTNLNQITTNLPSENQHLIWESQPTLDKINNILFFASDRIGGYGGVDIWYMKKNGDDWGEPINCGPYVNSSCDDITPFVSPTKRKLYFSTEARDNVGGYDIFKIDYTIKDGMPQFNSEPTNMGSPINTKYDEISPNFPDYSDNYFYFSSDQDGDYDIYVLEKVFKNGQDSVEYKQEEKKKPDEALDVALKEDTLIINPNFNLEGIVKDNRTNKPVENVDVTVKKDEETTPHKSTKTNVEGKYRFELTKGHQYEVEVKNDTLFNDSFKIFVAKNDTNNTFKRNLIFDTKKTVRINFKYDQYDKPYEYILDSLGNQINTTWQQAIESLAEDIQQSLPLLEKVIVTGYTDPVGSTSYNLDLGQKRAEFVVAKLVEKGIPIYILKAKTKGESEKLVKFDNEDEEQYHKRLRRVTLEKIFIK